MRVNVLSCDGVFRGLCELTRPGSGLQGRGHGKMPAMTDNFPRILPAGPGRLVVQFAAVLTDPANRAALAFRAAVTQADWPGVTDCATALASVFVGFDPLAPTDMRAQVARLLASRDWLAEPVLPGGSHVVPVVLDGPDLAGAATLAGLDVAQARHSLLR
jgi:allophanate hydrolase subunit 1